MSGSSVKGTGIREQGTEYMEMGVENELRRGTNCGLGRLPLPG
jgi:hypothetical protein